MEFFCTGHTGDWTIWGFMNRLDTPCTAGVRSTGSPRQILKSTPNITPQILQFLYFFPVTQSTSKTSFQSFKKVRQKFIKTGSKPDFDFEQFALIRTLWTPFSKKFQNFSKPQKSIVQNTIAHRHVVTPHILFAKSNYFPDGLTFQFWLCART